MFRIDVSPLISEARLIVQEAAAIYLKHTEPWFLGLLAHGSALKGGIVPGCSDVDLRLYLQTAAFTPQGHLPLGLAFAIHRDVIRIDPAPFRYIQCYPLSSELPEGFIGPIPGAYHVVAGELPVPEATAGQVRAAARTALTELNPTPAFLIGSLIGPGGVRLARRIRLLCTKVWPVLYQVLTLQWDDVLEIWRLSKDQAIKMLPQDTPLGRAIRRFYRAVRIYYPAEDSVEDALSIIQSGVGFLKAAKTWREKIGE
jgi:hypothetical protein